MIRTLLVIFWLGMLTVGYTYVGYGMIIYILSKLKRRSSPLTVQTDSELPDITLLVAAYNEEAYILDKIHNTLALDYPKNKLKLFFVTDGSNDRTPEIIRNFPEIEVFHSPERRGKIHAVNRVMKHVSTPIVVFCDANTALNRESLKLIVRHYQDPSVGGVAGEKRILAKDKDNASGAGEGLYWKYESFLKKKDAEVYSIVGAAGELFSLRTALFEEPAENMLMVKNDDRPGVIGVVGTTLGDAGVNIADMDVGRAKVSGTAVMLIAPTAAVPAEVVAALRAAPGIISVDQLAG